MRNPLSGVFMVLAIVQLLFLSVFLFTQSAGKKLSHVLLGFFFLCICLNLLDVLFLNSGMYDAVPFLAGWGSCLPLLFGPLIFLFTQSVTRNGFQFSKRYFIHFVPFLILWIGSEIYYLVQPVEVKEKFLTDLKSHHFPPWISIASFIIFLQFLFYVVLSLQWVARYKKNSGQFFSDRKNTNVSWLYTTLIFLIGVILISGLNSIFSSTSLSKYYLLFFNMVILALLIYLYRVLFHAMSNPHFLSFEEEERVPVDAKTSAKLNIPVPESAETDKILQKITDYMQVHKPYLDSELTLDELATQLSLKPRFLSQLINQKMGHNFFDYINRFRIEEASRLLHNPSDKKITALEVLYQVGFNSKSSFNTLFKKYTGLTPSEYKKKNLL